MRRRGRAARRRHRGGGHAPARAVRAARRCRSSTSTASSGSSCDVDGVGDERRGVQSARSTAIDGRASRAASRSDHPQERRADRADAARRQGRRRDARGVHPRRRSRVRPRSTSTAVAREVIDAPRRPLELPRLPRLPRGGVHVAERRDRARHPERRRRARRGRHPLDRLRRDHRGLARRRRDHRADRRDRRRVAAADRRHPASLEAAIEQVVEGNRSATSAPRSRASPRRPGSRVVREYVGHGIGTAMHEDPQVPNYGPAGRGMKLKEGHVLAIEPMVNAGEPRDRGARRRLDRRHPRRPPLRPLRAHHRRHRARPRGPHPPAQVLSPPKLRGFLRMRRIPRHVRLHRQGVGRRTFDGEHRSRVLSVGRTR